MQTRGPYFEMIQESRRYRGWMKTAELASARTCYGHLAGRAGVELLDAMVARGLLLEQSSGRTGLAGTPGPRFDVTDTGARTLGSFGLNTGELRGSRRRFAGTCVDWTERRWHLNGALAVAITTRLFELSWIERGSGRSVRITAAGAAALAQTFGLRSVLAGAVLAGAVLADEGALAFMRCGAGRLVRSRYR
jgi:hypothetical protein